MSKLSGLTFRQRGCRRWGGLLIASSLILWLVAVRSVAAQTPPVPLLKGGVKERSLKSAPGTDPRHTRPQNEEACKATQELIDIDRKALESPEVTQSQAWRDAWDKYNEVDQRARGTYWPPPTRADDLLGCLTCPAQGAFMAIEGLWRTRNVAQEAGPNAFVAQTEVKAMEDCFQKVCWRTRTYPQIPVKTPRHPSGTVSGTLTWDATVLENKQRVHRKGNCRFDLRFDANGSAYANSLDYQNTDTTFPPEFPGLRVDESTVASQRPTSGSFTGYLRVVPNSGGYEMSFTNPQFPTETSKQGVPETVGLATCAMGDLWIQTLHGQLGPVLKPASDVKLPQWVPQVVLTASWSVTP